MVSYCVKINCKKKKWFTREDETYIVGVLMNSFKCVPVFQIELEFGRVGF